MLELVKIAVTGGIASGKTTVCRFFQELGSYVVSADAIVHDLLENDTDLKQRIVRQLGPEILQDEKIDRKKIAEKVFKNPKQLDSLEKILHPAVLKRIQELYRDASAKGNYRFFVVEVPLLYEIQRESFYDVTIAVLADEKIARERFEKTGYSKEEYDERMHRQLPSLEKSNRADYTLHNNESLADLKQQVISLNKTLQKY